MYRRLYRYLRGQIELGIYAVGDELPAIEQVGQQFDFSDRLSSPQA